ncbi:MAG: hypothetical protein P1V51_12710 [Deltaproteobacteria bacterium]|nr:hypothetical protein [Deltaproteobacteria bacterium]
MNEVETQGGLLRLSGQVAVPQNPRAAADHVVRGFIGGAVGAGLEITHRDSRSIAFRAVTLGALCTGVTAGWLRVDDTGADARVLYRLSVASSALFGLVPGLGAGLLSTLVPVGEGPGGRVLLALGVGAVVALGWAGWVLRRNRKRIETFLHNLRYAS